jgi:hypothetical protein
LYVFAINSGYPCEQHYVSTPDGFVLGLHRIPYGRESRNFDAALPSPASSVLASVLASSGMTAVTTVPSSQAAFSSLATSGIPVGVDSKSDQTTATKRHHGKKGLSSRTSSRNSSVTNLVQAGNTNISDAAPSSSLAPTSTLRHRPIPTRAAAVIAGMPPPHIPSVASSTTSSAGSHIGLKSSSPGALPSPGVVVHSTSDWDPNASSIVMLSSHGHAGNNNGGNGGTNVGGGSSQPSLRSRSPSPTGSSLASDYSPQQSPPGSPSPPPAGIPPLITTTSSSSTPIPSMSAPLIPRQVSTALTVATPPRPVVLIHHGFLQCSEAWVAKPDNLAFALADAGYIVPSAWSYIYCDPIE